MPTNFSSFDDFNNFMFTFSTAPKVSRIIRNGPATIVFWNDGTKTVVKKAENSYDDPYAAFCAALAKKVYGSNSAVKKILSQRTVDENF